MRKYDPSLPLYFVHVPRTAGTIVGILLTEMLGPGRYLRDDFLNPPVPIGAGMIYGMHWNTVQGLDVMDRYPDARQFITILRDPFSMLVSFYFLIKNFWCSDLNFNSCERIRLSDYGNSLAGFLDGYPADQTRFMPSSVPGMCLLPEMLDDFVFVGISGRLESAIRFLADMFGKPPPKMCRGNPCGPMDEPVTDDMRRQFRTDHPQDYVLYDYAIRTWRPVWAQHSPG